jgi:chaperonin cofactor prefoldin
MIIELPETQNLIIAEVKIIIKHLFPSDVQKVIKTFIEKAITEIDNIDDDQMIAYIIGFMSCRFAYRLSEKLSEQVDEDEVEKAKAH